MKIGFIVNPIAGMGGKPGLKGTDNIVKEAIRKGAKPTAPHKAIEFLQRLRAQTSQKKPEIWTCPGIMGENEAKAAGFPVKLLNMKLEQETNAEDTKKAVGLLVELHSDLIIFVGGDGTAKDVLDALGDNKIPVLGVPAGVKMYSGVFAVNASDAAEVVLAFAQEQVEIAELEVMDANENDIRRDQFSVKLYGYLKTPSLPLHVQGSKQISPETVDEKDNQLAIARFIIEELPRDVTLILGPGTTVKSIAELLGFEKTLLGVDLCQAGKVTLDVSETEILKRITDWSNVHIVVSPIGHQGILFGRGNQQISPEIVKMVGKERIIIAATKAKLKSIEGGTLRVDMGDADVEKMLRGYIRVVTDFREWRLVQVQ